MISTSNFDFVFDATVRDWHQKTNLAISSFCLAP